MLLNISTLIVWLSVFLPHLDMWKQKLHNEYRWTRQNFRCCTR